MSHWPFPALERILRLLPLRERFALATVCSQWAAHVRLTHWWPHTWRRAARTLQNVYRARKCRLSTAMAAQFPCVYMRPYAQWDVWRLRPNGIVDVVWTTYACFDGSEPVSKTVHVPMDFVAHTLAVQHVLGSAPPCVARACGVQNLRVAAPTVSHTFPCTSTALWARHGRRRLFDLGATGHAFEPCGGQAQHCRCTRRCDGDTGGTSGAEWDCTRRCVASVQLSALLIAFAVVGDEDDDDDAGTTQWPPFDVGYEYSFEAIDLDAPMIDDEANALAHNVLSQPSSSSSSSFLSRLRSLTVVRIDVHGYAWSGPNHRPLLPDAQMMSELGGHAVQPTCALWGGDPFAGGLGPDVPWMYRHPRRALAMARAMGDDMVRCVAERLRVFEQCRISQ